jgi:hypothetical protein
MQNDLTSYVEVIRSFVQGGIPAADFQRRYLSLFKSDHRLFSDEEFQILNYLFSSCDQFSDVPALFDKRNISSNQLMRDAMNALEALEKLS